METDPELVSRLLAAQFPRWADLPVSRVDSAGTDNALYRLGDDMAVRLPRVGWAMGQVEKEHQWLSQLAPLLPLQISDPLVKGEPGEGYPWQWSVYRWLEGENATLDRVNDPNEAAIELAEFIAALQRIELSGGSLTVERGSRGVPLATRDEATRKGITSLEAEIDTDAAMALWESALRAKEWDGPPAWFHGDMLPGNLLFEVGRLSAVIDFGGLGVGDPACDLMIAWAFFAGESRECFREALAVDDAAWARGRGHALSQAVLFIPYYLRTNPVGVANARHLLDEVLADYRVTR